MTPAQAAESVASNFEQALTEAEGKAEHADLARRAIRSAEILRNLNLPVKVSVPTDKQMEQLQEMASPANSGEWDALVEQLQASMTLNLVPADKGQELLDRYYALVGTSTGRTRSGAPMEMECECGFIRHSYVGDWTALRHQANMHSRDCKKASATKAALDAARVALYEKEDTEATAGGVTFRRITA